jgi:hypothetical protein
VGVNSQCSCELPSACALGVTPCSHNPARMTAGSVRQGGSLMRVPSSPRLNPPFDGGRTGRSRIARIAMNSADVIVPIVMGLLLGLLLALWLWG